MIDSHVMSNPGLGVRSPLDFLIVLLLLLLIFWWNKTRKTIRIKSMSKSKTQIPDRDSAPYLLAGSPPASRLPPPASRLPRADVRASALVRGRARLLRAESKFRRVEGHQAMPTLLKALESVVQGQRSGTKQRVARQCQEEPPSFQLRMGQFQVPTLVLLPGLDGTGLLFERFVAALPSEIQTRIIDYPRVVASLEEHAATVAAQLPSGRVSLLAESFSGIVALHLLRNRRVSVEKMIFVASFGSAPKPYLKLFLFLLPTMLRFTPLISSAVWRHLCLMATTPAADIAWVKESVAQVPPGVLAHRLRLVASAKIGDGRPIDVPAYYIQADGDRLVPRAAAKQLQKTFRQFTLLHVPGPHFLLQSSPTVCAQLIAGIVLDASAK